jgi:hypothetical protein
VRYRVDAELRRAHGGAPWRLSGVWVDGQSFWPIEGVAPARRRAWEAGNVTLAGMWPVLAPTPAVAALVGLDLAKDGVWRLGGHVLGPGAVVGGLARWGEVSSD